MQEQRQKAHDVVGFFKEAWGVTAPIYLFSDIPEDELKERADEAGANGYISKSWGLEVLVEKVLEITADK